jgi:hypothetical protein
MSITTTGLVARGYGKFVRADETRRIGVAWSPAGRFTSRAGARSRSEAAT